MIPNFWRNRGYGFRMVYTCIPVDAEREDVANGGKIILPPSALETLTHRNVEFPMLFKLSNPETGAFSHAGVLEFVANEEYCQVPSWMLRNLGLQDGADIRVESASLPVATFSRFQPLSKDFLDISNPTAMLENALRTFACLTVNDTIAVKYNDKIYELLVLETKPEDAVKIIECDMDVDFAPPADYVEESIKKVESRHLALPGTSESSHASFIPFLGAGNRIDGKEPDVESSPQGGARGRIGPDYDWEIGSIDLYRGPLPIKSKVGESQVGFEPFSGPGVLPK